MVSPAAVNGYTIADVTDRRDDELKGQGGAAGAELPTQPAQHGERNDERDRERLHEAALMKVQDRKQKTRR